MSSIEKMIKIYEELKMNFPSNRVQIMKIDNIDEDVNTGNIEVKALIDSDNILIGKQMLRWDQQIKTYKQTGIIL